MGADAPTKVDVVTFCRKRLHHQSVLRMPIPLRIVDVPAPPAIIVQPILKKYPDRLALAGLDYLWIGVATADIGETSDRAQHFAELIRAMPSHRKRADRTRTGAADA